jgi:serine/threonine-protein kinase
VADFGIAQLGSEDTLTVSGEVLGTAAYLAPERALGQPATEASDRYALAVAAYELMVGERPFTAEHFAAQARQHLEETPPRASQRNPGLPATVDAVLARGMAKRAEDRFPTCLQLTDAIEEALVATSVTRPMAPTAATRPLAATADFARLSAARSPGRPGTPQRAPIAHRSRARVGILAALAAALLGIGIAAAASGGGGSRTAGHTTASHATRPKPAAKPHAKTSAKPQSTAAQPSTGATSASPPPPTTPSTPAPSGGASGLEAQGHALMEAGNYRGAIPVLRQAVAAASPNSLTYAYALYDLGRSLRLAGDPRAAAQILYRRLQIPNQTATVRAELALALEALGQQASRSGDSGHHGSGRGGGQGD